MFRFVALPALVLTGFGMPQVPAIAASFDCGKAETPFEHAICNSDELSTADERLARTYATATGGLSEIAAEQMRTDQRQWLDYARRACNADAKPLISGAYDEDGVSCLVDLFDSRSQVLETSRMIQGLRFYPVSEYAAMPDPEAERGSAWEVARHELSMVQLDEDQGFAYAFSDTVREEGNWMQGEAETVANDASSNSTNSISVKEVAGRERITLEANTYWYGHGAAHGNYTISYLHYLTDKGRFMEGGDIFTGKKWQQALLDLAVDALRVEHGDMLMLDDTQYIAEPVANPRRWDLSSPYGLVIQFQPYEVAAYAYGAPTATVSWEALRPYMSEDADRFRFGF